MGDGSPGAGVSVGAQLALVPVEPAVPGGKPRAKRAKAPADADQGHHRLVFDAYWSAFIACKNREPSLDRGRIGHGVKLLLTAVGQNLEQAVLAIRGAFSEAWWVERGCELAMIAKTPDRFVDAGLRAPSGPGDGPVAVDDRRPLTEPEQAEIMGLASRLSWHGVAKSVLAAGRGKSVAQLRSLREASTTGGSRGSSGGILADEGKFGTAEECQRTLDSAREGWLDRDLDPEAEAVARELFPQSYPEAS